MSFSHNTPRHEAKNEPYQPRHAKPENMHTFVDRLALPSNWEESILPEHREECRLLYSHNGAAFLAYLENLYTEELPVNITEDFNNIYISSYNSLDEWAEDTLDGLGWKEAIESVLEVEAIPTEALNWDHNFLVRFAESMLFQFHYHIGKVHVFQI